MATADYRCVVPCLYHDRRWEEDEELLDVALDVQPPKHFKWIGGGTPDHLREASDGEQQGPMETRNLPPARSRRNMEGIEEGSGRKSLDELAQMEAKDIRDYIEQRFHYECHPQWQKTFLLKKIEVLEADKQADR